MLGHGLAAQALRAGSGRRGRRDLNLYPVTPATGGAADAEAARRIDGLANRFFLDPILRGAYPEDLLADLRPVTDLDHVRDGDLATISTPLDLVGVNYYSRHVVAAPVEGAEPEKYWRAPSCWPGSEDVRFVSRGVPVTDMDWEIDAPGLVETLRRVHEEYTDLPCTSPRTARPSSTRWWTARCTTRTGSATSTPTCGRRTRRSAPGCRCGDTSPGR
jgi:beta-glucosidase